jgi:hypothetical protein
MPLYFLATILATNRGSQLTCACYPLYPEGLETPALHALIITEDEWIFLAELHEVLETLWEETQWVSQKAPTITQSVNVY